MKSYSLNYEVTTVRNKLSAPLRRDLATVFSIALSDPKILLKLRRDANNRNK